MKIALLSTLPPDKNGIANYAAHFYSALEQIGVEVAKPFQGSEKISNLAEALTFIDNYDWSEVDLIHAEIGGGRVREFFTVKALRLRFPKLPITATVHDPERLIWRPETLPWPFSLTKSIHSIVYKLTILLFDPLTLRSERAVAKELSHIITLTNMGATALQNRMKLPSDKVSVIPHGNIVVPRQGLPPLQPLRMLYFGFIYRGKGIEDLLDALHLVVENTPALKKQLILTIAGGIAPVMAFDQEGNYLEELKLRINSLGLQEMIEWDIDVAEEGIPVLIQNHHVMVLPYQESKKIKLLGAIKGTSGALSWAIACGRGVITSDARSFAEEVKSGNGVVYSQGDVTALANTIIQLTQQPDKTIVWAQTAQHIAEQRAWLKTAQNFKNIFTQVIAKGV